MDGVGGVQSQTPTVTDESARPSSIGFGGFTENKASPYDAEASAIDDDGSTTHGEIPYRSVVDDDRVAE